MMDVDLIFKIAAIGIPSTLQALLFLLQSQSFYQI